MFLHVAQEHGLGKDFFAGLFGLGTGGGKQKVKVTGGAAGEAEHLLDGGDATHGEVALLFDNAEHMARI